MCVHQNPLSSPKNSYVANTNHEPERLADVRKDASGSHFFGKHPVAIRIKLPKKGTGPTSAVRRNIRREIKFLLLENCWERGLVLYCLLTKLLREVDNKTSK